MKKTLLFSACCAVGAFAQINVLPATPANIEKFEQIVDIRTPAEWRDTGIINGAKTIVFSKDKEKFIEAIKEQVDITKPFAIICRSGGRTASAAQMLDEADMNVTNLDGGMNLLIKSGYMTTPYSK
ncbi:rhodanese-like domain-containing protein [Campylobacter suis]|uniref:Rhodanese domain-containing protein n=1 Tax=Campylobacter suis TaxID=2790657 RepID=A0ABM8Q6U2_9BACT|nr:rhodanese-like domain-containing protein [Campylobacter suis]CAD7288526.1 hypothetical protein LMG8286_01376 [Campylobacter suis]